MNKKSLNKKVVKQTIIEERENGKTDQEIYNELSQLYYDTKTIALLITGTVTKANKKKYKIYNNILLGFIGLTIAIKVMSVESMALLAGQLWALSLVFIAPLLNVYFFIEIARYNAPVYRMCGMLSILSFLHIVGNVENPIDLLINVVLCSAIAGLSFYLDGKLFPNFSPQNLKKDNNGEYIV